MPCLALLRWRSKPWAAFKASRRQLLEQLNQDLQQTRLEEALQRQLKAQ